jgi:alkylation response protein AidB-like acyl-CoA dehydrogenase
MWITNAPIADVALVWARTEDGVRGFLVERGTPGFSAQELQHKFSLRTSSTGALFFDQLRLLALQLARLKQQDRLTAAQISLAKWNNCRAALEIARDCRDLLGGAGISLEQVAIRHMLNLESVATYEGTQTIHQLAVGRALTGISAF